MTTLKTKKRLMYTVFVFIFIFGGIEYAVVLPTLWLYLSNDYHAPEYMLGLVLSAYSLAAFFSSPIFGRIADRIGCTKQIFLVCAAFELAGSFLYFIGISQWLCLGSRFISGMGAAAEAIALAEVSRYTSEKERTGIMSKLVATRQIALLIGPGLNVFLRIADFKIGPFHVTKYTAPGAFMSILWVILMVIILTLYTEPKKIYTLEKQEQKRAREQEAKEQQISAEHDHAQNSDTDQNGTDSSVPISESSSNNILSKKKSGKPANNSEHRASVNQALNTTDSLPQATQKLAEPRTNKKELIQSDDGTEFIYPPLTYDLNQTDTSKDFVSEDAEVAVNRILSINDGENGKDTPVSLYASDESDNSDGEFHDIQTQHGNGDVTGDKFIHSSHDDNSSQGPLVSNEKDNDIENTMHLSNSLDLLMSAERLIYNIQWQKSASEVDHSAEVADGAGPSLIFKEDHFASGTNIYPDVAGGSGGYGDDEKSALLRAHQRSSQTSLLRTLGSNDPYIERSTSAFDDPVAIEGKMGFFCNEYIRDEIIAIVCLLFCAMFSQVCVETMVLPLSLKYLDFDELENSFLYCGCGVEIIIVFIMVSRLSRHLSDRVMMMFGVVMLLASNVWLICYLPTAPPHNRSKNIPFFAVAVFLDVLSLPFLVVCSTSLFSKLTRKQTQGLSQGLRRGVVGLGTVMAPMWGSSAVEQPYILLGVLVGLQSLSCVLCLLSYKRLKVTQQSSTTDVPVPSASAGGTINTKPRDVPKDSNNSRDASPRQIQQPSTAHSTPYGSIQRSVAGSSYCSLRGSSDEEQPLLSHHVA